MGIPINSEGTIGNAVNPTAAQLSALQQSNPALYDQLYAAVNKQAYADNADAQKQYDLANQTYELDKQGYDFAKSEYDKAIAAGPKTAEQIAADIAAQPGYQAQISQGIDAINKASSAKGYLGSGRVLKELNDFGQNTLSQYYGDTLSRLAALAGSGQQAAANAAQLSSNNGNSLAQLYQSLGDNRANSTLAGANSLSQALIAANQQYNVMQTGSSNSSSGGGGLGGIGQALGGIASLYSAIR
jgi:hypothetical protein